MEKPEVKSKEEITKYRKWLYADEYPEDDFPEDLINPPELSKEDILNYCAEAKELGFKYFSYCPNCHDCWYGASGLDVEKNRLELCSTCNYDHVAVYLTSDNSKLT